jgi:glycosyltransferase involved in cell wall biosynthesis
MLSFIVIGKNEEKNLKRTIEGIYRAIAYNHLRDYEIIYVDSRSTDRSLEIAEQFPEVRIFSITGVCNAAIARNIGGREAHGSAFFFIDADMEISGEFLEGVWDKKTGNINQDFVSGQLIDIENGVRIKRTFNKVLPGGIFIIKREVWEAVNGMNTKFTAGEDYDLGLRLMEKGYKFHRKPEVITNHYTVPILNESRIWKAMWSRYTFYPRCVLLRDHLFNRQMYVLLWRNDKPFILFVAALIALLIYPLAGLTLFAAYLVVVILRVIQQKKYLPFFQMLGYYLLFDILNLVYFFTFFPSRRKEEYKSERAKVRSEIKTS